MIELDVESPISTHNPKRHHKIHSRYYDYESNSPHPYIRLGGRYLERVGFNIGDCIEVKVEFGLITIKKI